MATEVDRTTEYNAAYNQASSHYAQYHTDARNDLKVYAGDPWTAKDRAIAKAKNRELMSFPQLRRVIKWMSGYEREHRLSITYDPMEGGDLETASQLNMVALWALQWQNGYNVVSDGFEGALKTGLNLINVYNDRNLNTKFERFMYHQFLLAPTWTRVDLADCPYGILRKYISPADAKMLLPGQETEIDRLSALTKVGGDEKFSFYRRPSLYGDKLMAYDEFQKRATRKRRIIIIRPTAEEIVFDGSTSELEGMIRGLAQAGIDPRLVSVVERWEPTIEVSAYLEKKEVSHGIDPFGLDDFSFSPLVAYFDPEMEHSNEQIQSIIHGLIDAQKLSDKRKIAVAAWIEQQIGAGLDYETGTLVDDRDAFKTGSGAPRVFEKDALKDQRARDRVVPDVPPGLFKDRESTNDEIPKMVGFNPEMMGFPANQNVKISGILSKLRTGMGLIGLRDLFDNRSVTMKMIGLKINKLIQQYPPSKIQRIINKPPTKEFFTRNFGKYDVAVAEGMLSDTQRGMAYAELVSLKELGANLSDPVPISWKDIIKIAPIQQSLELLKSIEQQEQQQAQSRKRQEQLNDTLQQLAIQQAQTEIEQQKALTEQQRTNAIENQAETALDRAKTATEIQELQGQNSMKLLQMAVDLEKARIGSQNKQ